jgi:Co/Zn/Cd efflux system component
MTLPGFYPATLMPDADWWNMLWPAPETVLAALGMTAGMDLAVDLCCGDGLFTPPLVRLARRVIAIDLDPEMIARARARLGASSCTFAVGDAYRIAEMLDAPADAVFMANTFHGVPDKPRLARAVAGVIEPGGALHPGQLAPPSARGNDGARPAARPEDGAAHDTERGAGGGGARRVQPVARGGTAALSLRCHIRAVLIGCSPDLPRDEMDACCAAQSHHPSAPDPAYRRVLWVALAMNAAMFIVEIGASLVAGSVSLQADALDFFGDAANYAVGLTVLGMAVRWRARAALAKGAVMAAFAVWVTGNTLWHAVSGGLPRAELMSGVGLLALAVNLGVAILLFRHRAGDSNRRSIWLCTRNDAIVNVAVILAGGAVWLTGTHWPDIAVASVVATLGLTSARQIVHQARAELRDAAAARRALV